MRLSDLNDEQRLYLAAWFILADASPPSPTEELPLEAQEALAELSASTGKYPRARFRHHRATTGLVHGRRRKARASKPKRYYELAT